MLSLLILMSALLGIASYSAGLLPLTFSSSKNLDQFSLLGAGLLVGTALGVILPEGIETLIRASPDTTQEISSSIALPLIIGFSFMLLLDQVISPPTHPKHPPFELKSATGLPLPLHSAHTPHSATDHHHVDFDAELRELEREEGAVSAGIPPTPSSANGIANGGQKNDVITARKLAMSRTLGLVVHSLADGFALGVSSLTDTVSKSLSTVVFLALAIHKAPTSLALSTSLLAIGLPRDECKKHLTVFAAATPVGALASYFVFSFLDTHRTNWTGIALLTSGGSFIYVATVLQSGSYHTSSTEMTKIGRISCMVAGIILPFLFSAILGHNH